MRSAAKSSLLFSLALALGACAGGYSGQFKGKGTGARVPAAQVKTVASKDAASGITYTELGTAKGQAPSAQEAVDMAKQHCGQNGGNLLILNTPPYESGKRWVADATCATDGAVKTAAGKTGGKPAR